MKQETHQRNSNIISMNQKLQQKKTSTPVWKSHSLMTKLIVICAIAVSGSMIVGIGNQISQANQLNQKIEQAKAEKEFAEKQKESLQQQVELLQSDEYIAKLARSEYYLSKTGEIIFSTPNDTAQYKAQQSKEEVEKGETVVKVTTQNR